jgi:3-oxoacyl-[acyl-carrier protein] reductase
MTMLTNKIAFITGASRGIGYETALAFAKQGATLILNGKDPNRLMELHNRLTEQFDTKAYLLPYDVRDSKEIQKAFQWIKKNLGRLDVLVNNAGVLDAALLGMVTEQQMSNTYAVNVEAVIYHMQYASRLMTRQQSGSIINVSSVMGISGDVGQVVYSSSKAAVIGATYSAAKELGPYNVRVNAVAPGFIDTDMTKELSEDQYARRISEIKMNRFGKPEEVANTILFLSSSLSTYVTGQVIGVDGGLVI